MEIARPHLLSLHPTMQCDYNCFNCYLKKDITGDAIEKSPDFFMKLIEHAKKVGMTEVALAVNFMKKDDDFKLLDDPMPVWDSVDKNLYYFMWTRDKCREVGLEFTMTCNYDFIENYRDILDFSDVALVSVSINDFVTSTPEKKKEAIETLRFLKTKVPIVNCNLLVSDATVKQLNNGLDDEILAHADTIFLLFSAPLYIPLNKVYGQLKAMKHTILTMIDERVLLSTCIKREMDMSGGVCNMHEQIFVNPYGEIKLCSYDTRNLFVLQAPEDLEHVYQNLYPAKPLLTCDLINGKLVAENRKKAMDMDKILRVKNV